MDSAFVDLREYLRAPERPAQASDRERANEREASSAPADPALREIAGQMRRFRAALYDAYDAVRAQLLRDLVCDVLGRELQLAPADVDAIARRACEQIDAIACVRVHPDDVAALSAWTCAVEADATLHRGDVLLCVRDGTIDASLGVRLEGVLASLACA